MWKMKATFFPISLLGCLLMIFIGRSCLADAKSMVVSKLEKAGLEVGYDEERQRFVVVGAAEEHTGTLPVSMLFDKTRNDLGKKAALNARRELMYMLALRVQARDSVDAVYTGGRSLAEVRTAIEQFSSLRLSGCKTLCTAESYDGESGVYQVAVALGWSSRVARDAANAVVADLERTDDEAVYEAWCNKNDLSSMIGGRDFTDEKGVRRYVGIGAVDIEGKKGKMLAMAFKNARVKAQENLVVSLSVDAAAHDVAQRFVKEVSYGNVEARGLWERFSSEVFAHSRLELKNQKEVYSVTVSNPVTGRQMYVSVVGLTAKSSDSGGVKQ